MCIWRSSRKERLILRETLVKKQNKTFNCIWHRDKMWYIQTDYLYSWVLRDPVLGLVFLSPSLLGAVCWGADAAGDTPEDSNSSGPACKPSPFSHSSSDCPVIHVVLVDLVRTLNHARCHFCDSACVYQLLLLTSISPASRHTCSPILQAAAYSEPAPSNKPQLRTFSQYKPLH